jgi:hypothetical protein
MNIARIKDGIVVNIEVADREWLEKNQGLDGFYFIEWTYDSPAYIGYGWNELSGFEQPAVDVFVAPAVAEEELAS